jgi:hypothetical protein
MGYSSMLPGVCKLGYVSNSANSFFGSLSGARLRANGILTAVKAKELAREKASRPDMLSGRDEWQRSRERRA